MKKSLLSILLLLGVVFLTFGCGAKETGFNTIDTQVVKAALEDSNAVVVDTRLNDAFNGWQLDNVKRGGHIDGATDFSANWLQADIENKEAVLDKALETKGITKDKSIVLYDGNGTDAKAVGSYLKDKGYENISTYDVNAWADDDSLAMVSYPNFEKIVPAVAVKDLLDGKDVQTFDKDKKVKMVEASWGEATETYDSGHIPTAFHVNTDSIEPPPAWMLDSDEALTAWALENGFTKDDVVVVSGSGDQLAPYRVAVVLQYLGVEDVRVLNGGSQAWTAAGYDLSTEATTPTAVTDFGATIPGRPELIDTTEEVKANLDKTDTFTLVDNRTWDEHIGKISGYSYHDKMGRIPGAIFGFAGIEGSSAMDFYTNPDGTMRNQEEIKDMLTTAGIDLDKHLSFMCGSGWRVSQILTYAQVMGLDNTSIYSDGWIGWSNDPSNPTVTGLEGITYVPEI